MPTKRKSPVRAKKTATTAAASADSLESRVGAFAEQIGRLAGTVIGKADGLIDRAALQQQLTAVRDGAAGLLQHIAGRDAAADQPAAAAAAASARDAGAPRRRSGGKVDAPGKKHRAPLPADPDASKVTSQAAKLRVARPMAKTGRLRGRG